MEIVSSRQAPKRQLSALSSIYRYLCSGYGFNIIILRNWIITLIHTQIGIPALIVIKSKFNLDQCTHVNAKTQI